MSSNLTELAARAARGENVQGLSILPHTPGNGQVKFSEDTEREMLKRAGEEEQFKRDLMIHQITYKEALEAVMNLTTVIASLDNGEIDRPDKTLVRETRRAALNVLKSLLETSPS